MCLVSCLSWHTLGGGCSPLGFSGREGEKFCRAQSLLNQCPKWKREQLCWMGCKSWEKTGFSVPCKLPVQLGKAFLVSHPRALLRALMPLPFRRGCSDLSGFVGLGSPAIYSLAPEATFVQVSEQRGWALPVHVAYYLSLFLSRPKPGQPCIPGSFAAGCPGTAGLALPHCGGCRRGQGVLRGETSFTLPLHVYFLPLPSGQKAVAGASPAAPAPSSAQPPLHYQGGKGPW